MNYIPFLYKTNHNQVSSCYLLKVPRIFDFVLQDIHFFLYTSPIFSQKIKYLMLFISLFKQSYYKIFENKMYTIS